MAARMLSKKDKREAKKKFRKEDADDDATDNEDKFEKVVRQFAMADDSEDDEDGMKVVGKRGGSSRHTRGRCLKIVEKQLVCVFISLCKLY